MGKQLIGARSSAGHPPQEGTDDDDSDDYEQHEGKTIPNAKFQPCTGWRGERGKDGEEKRHNLQQLHFSLLVIQKKIKCADIKVFE